MDDKERLNNFLKELAELTNKYKISIGGCGCCGSPYLDDLNTDSVEMGSCLKYDYDKGTYIIDIS